MGLNEIARNLQIAKSTVHGITSALHELGVIIRDPFSNRYRRGCTLFELGSSVYSRIDLKDLARPFMEELMAKTQASVFLGVLNWEHVTILDIVESQQELKITSPIGTTIPLLAGAVGKVFLACMEEEKAIEIILSKGLTKFTGNSITDPKRYSEEIQRVRRLGYATDDEEYILGVRAVASPILGEKHLASAIWVVGFKASLDEKKMKLAARETKRIAEAISKSIIIKYPKSN
jgi:DNA-binding IclR family transcriptional regulator